MSVSGEKAVFVTDFTPSRLLMKYLEKEVIKLSSRRNQTFSRLEQEWGWASAGESKKNLVF
jgi:hypothetical protein